MHLVRDTRRKVSALAGGYGAGRTSLSLLCHALPARPPAGAALSTCGSLMRVSLKIIGLLFVPARLSAQAMPARPVDRAALQDEAVECCAP